MVVSYKDANYMIQVAPSRFPTTITFHALLGSLRRDDGDGKSELTNLHVYLINLKANEKINS